MSNKRKRSTTRWSVLAIEFMIVLVAMVATITILFPKHHIREIRVIEVVETASEPTHTDELIESSYNAALDYMYNKDYSRSANLLEDITNVAKDHYWSHVTYSFVLYEQGEYNEAMTVASQGIKINPNDPVAWNNRCLLRALTGDYTGALVDCNHSIKVDPTYDYNYNNRCYILIQLDQLDAAERDCLQALGNSHRMPEWVYTNLGTIALNRGLLHVAEEHFLTALGYNGTHADAYAGLGNLQLIRANYRSALNHYEAYRQYAGVHFNPRFEAKIDYVKETLANLGEN